MRSANRLRLPALTIGLAAVAAASLAGAGGSSASAAAPSRVSPGHSADAPATPIYLNRAYSPAERAADLVSRMTTAEKAAQMDSSQAPAIPSLGVAAWGWWNEANTA